MIVALAADPYSPLSKPEKVAAATPAAGIARTYLF